MRLVWDDSGKRFFEAGVSKGVLFLKDKHNYKSGVVWNGLINITESPKGSEPNPVYANDDKYIVLYSPEEYEATIEAFTYPDEFSYCTGEAYISKGAKAAQQLRKSFGFSYVTGIGNDTKDGNVGYKIHIVYNAVATSSQKDYTSKSKDVEPLNFSWTITSIPQPIDIERKTSHIVIDSTKCDLLKLAALEDALYGSSISNSHLLMPHEIISIMGEYIPPEDPVDQNQYINGLPFLDTKEF